VLGTNGVAIVNNEAVSAAKGTDFGQIVCNSAATNTFSITNAATTALTISSWTTNGAGAVKFSVIDMPATVAGNSLSNFSVSFNPGGSAGTYTATVSIVNFGTNTPYLVNLQGESLSEGAIGISPALLTYTATYNGTNPAVQTFTLTNSGETAYTYTNTVTYGAGTSGWFTPVPTNGSVAAGNSRICTGSVNIAGLNTGHVLRDQHRNLPYRHEQPANASNHIDRNGGGRLGSGKCHAGDRFLGLDCASRLCRAHIRHRHPGSGKRCHRDIWHRLRRVVGLCSANQSIPVCNRRKYNAFYWGVPANLHEYRNARRRVGDRGDLHE